MMKTRGSGRVRVTSFDFSSCNWDPELTSFLLDACVLGRVPDTFFGPFLRMPTPFSSAAVSPAGCDTGDAGATTKSLARGEALAAKPTGTSRPLTPNPWRRCERARRMGAAATARCTRSASGTGRGCGARTGSGRRVKARLLELATRALRALQSVLLVVIGLSVVAYYAYIVVSVFQALVVGSATHLDPCPAAARVGKWMLAWGIIGVLTGCYAADVHTGGLSLIHI